MNSGMLGYLDNQRNGNRQGQGTFQNQIIPAETFARQNKRYNPNPGADPVTPPPGQPTPPVDVPYGNDAQQPPAVTPPKVYSDPTPPPVNSQPPPVNSQPKPSTYNPNPGAEQPIPAPQEPQDPVTSGFNSRRSSRSYYAPNTYPGTE